MLDEVTKSHIEECKQDMMKHVSSEIANYTLSEVQMDAIAERAADRAIAKMTELAYREVGKGILNKLFYITGVVVVALYLYLQSHGWVK